MWIKCLLNGKEKTVHRDLCSLGGWFGSSEAQHAGHGFQEQLERRKHERRGKLHQHNTVRTDLPFSNTHQHFLCKSYHVRTQKNIFFVLIYPIDKHANKLTSYILPNWFLKWSFVVKTLQWCLWPAVWSGYPEANGWIGYLSHSRTRYVTVILCKLINFHFHVVSKFFSSTSLSSPSQESKAPQKSIWATKRGFPEI